MAENSFGSITYEYEIEEDDGSITEYLKFKIDYCYANYPNGYEITKITCLQIGNEKDLDWITRTEYESLFNSWINSDDELYKNVIEMCFENANQYYEESYNED